MPRPTHRDQETRDLIRRFEARRARRRRLRLLLAVMGGAVLTALLVTVVVLATRGSSGEVAAGSTSTSAETPTESTVASGLTNTTGGIPTTGGALTTDEGSGTTTPPTTTEPPSTTLPSSSTTSATIPATSTSSTMVAQPSGFVVVIDPGHQAQGDSDLEPIGPGADEKKAKVSSGTAGVATGIPESELVLAVGLKLAEVLEARGIRVVMTRTTQDVNISNIQRAQIANEAGADLFVRVHADGSSNPDVHGIHVLYPPSVTGWTDDIAEASKRAATLAQQTLIAATGAKDRGIDPRDDMTGFNWSDVPVILPEIGFMTNPDEDRLLATESYQDKIVQALTEAILSFLGVN